MKELTVSIKNSEQTYKEKFLIYDTFTCESDDATIKQCVDDAISHFKGEVDAVTVRVKLLIQ